MAILEVNNVCKSFKTSKKSPEVEVLKDINFEVKTGKTIAFVGNSGGGKSTLVSLLPRFYDVCSGASKFDGEDIRHLRLDALPESLSKLG